MDDNPRVGAEARHEPAGLALEAAALERFADGLGRQSAAVVVRGEPGIGKTTLWGYALAAAEASGVLVLTARCVEAEMPVTMCGLADLLEPVVSVLDELPIPQGEALAGALGLETGARLPPDRIALPRAVTAALRALSERSPVLVAVDDVQWLDPASARLLAFALRRLVDRPLGALVTLRGGSFETDPLALELCFGRDRFDEIRLGPLSPGALGHLLRSSSLDAHVPRPALKRIHEVSGGNPMYALELLRGVPEGGDARPLAHVPLPASLDELMRARISRLPAAIGALLETTAALERPTLALLRRATDDALALVDAAVTAEALVVDDDGMVRFTHPLLASAVYARIPPSRRRDLHAQLAALVEDPEERARHLALAADGPDHEIAAALDEAAGHAAARGAPDVAGILIEHARRLTPPGDALSLTERVLTEAAYLLEVDEQDRALAILDELLSTPLAGPPRARALALRYVPSSPPNGRESLALLEQALEPTGEDRPLHVRLLCWLAYVLGSYHGEYAGAEERAREAVELADGLGDDSLKGLAVDALFHITTVRGTPRPAAFEDLLAVGRPGQVGEFPPAVFLARERRCAGDLDTGRALLERELIGCERRGQEHARAAILCELADIELRAGNWNLAGFYLDDALGVQIDGQDLCGQALTRSAQALLAAHRGDVAEGPGASPATPSPSGGSTAGRSSWLATAGSSGSSSSRSGSHAKRGPCWRGCPRRCAG